jgi:hypothetical protein
MPSHDGLDSIFLHVPLSDLCGLDNIRVDSVSSRICGASIIT